MPYIHKDERRRLDANLAELSLRIMNSGELSYAITKLALQFSKRLGNKSFANLAAATGVLELTLDEWKRRKIYPYEDQKCEENGDVY